MNEQKLTDIAHVTRFAEHTTPFWQSLNPEVFYKDGEAYGLIATREVNGITYIASATSKPDMKFTVGMLRYIKKLYQEKDICLITEHQDYQPMIVEVLNKYEFRYQMIDNILYSYNNKG